METKDQRAVGTTQTMEKADEKATIYAFKFKHLECSLHFEVFSWKPNWVKETRIYCPQDGGTDNFVIYQETLHGQISDFVPGKANLLKDLSALKGESVKENVGTLATRRDRE